MLTECCLRVINVNYKRFACPAEAGLGLGGPDVGVFAEAPWQRMRMGERERERSKEKEAEEREREREAAGAKNGKQTMRKQQKHQTVSCVILGSSLGAPSEFFNGGSWGLFGSSWGLLGSFWGILGCSWAVLEGSLDVLGAL